MSECKVEIAVVLKTHNFQDIYEIIEAIILEITKIFARFKKLSKNQYVFKSSLNLF